MSDNCSDSDQEREMRKRQRTLEEEWDQFTPQPDSSPPRTRAAASSAATVTPTPHGQDADNTKEAEDDEFDGENPPVADEEKEEEEILPEWKAKLKEAVKVDTSTNERVSVWAKKMFIGDGAAMKGVLEHIKTISFPLDGGKTAYKVGETDGESVTNLEHGWKELLGKLADDYAYSVYIKDRRIYLLQDRHVPEFEQVLTGVIPKGKGGARETFRKLQSSDLEVLAQEFNKLPEQGRKITDLHQQTTAMVTLREKLNWTRLTDKEVEKLQTWFKTGKVTGGDGAASGDMDKPKKLPVSEALDLVATVLNTHYDLPEGEEFTVNDLRDPDQTKLWAKLTGPQPE